MEVTNIFIAVAAVLMIYGAWQDLRVYRIPYISILGVAVLGLAYRYYSGHDLLLAFYIALASGLALFFLAWLYQLRRKKPALGYGDMQLFVVSVLWININHLALFFILTGVFTVLYGLIFFRNKYIPMAPAIALAWGVSIYLLL